MYYLCGIGSFWNGLKLIKLIKNGKNKQLSYRPSILLFDLLFQFADEILIDGDDAILLFDLIGEHSPQILNCGGHFKIFPFLVLLLKLLRLLHYLLLQGYAQILVLSLQLRYRLLVLLYLLYVPLLHLFQLALGMLLLHFQFLGQF